MAIACGRANYPDSFFYYLVIYLSVSADRSGPAVACLTAVREVLGSNRAAGSCVCRKNHCHLQPWAQAVCTLPAVSRSAQPSTLRGSVNEYQLSG